MLLVQHLTSFGTNSFPAREQVVLKAKEHKSPSTEAELSELSRRQRPGEDDALYNGRPRALAPPPIAIYHPVFSSFSRQISATPDPTSFSEKEIETACELVTVSSNYYPDDADRRSAIADLLAEGTGQDSFLTGGPVHLSSTRHDILPDGTVLVRCRKLSPDGARAYAQFGELKNEIGKGGCDPIAQAECDYVSVYTSDVVSIYCTRPSSNILKIHVLGRHHDSTSLSATPAAVLRFSSPSPAPTLPYQERSFLTSSSVNASSTICTSVPTIAEAISMALFSAPHTYFAVYVIVSPFS